MKLNDKLYDVLKWVCMIGLPAVGTLYKVLSGIWWLPLGDEVLATITAICAFLGAILGISTAEYRAEQNKAQYENKLNELSDNFR